MPDPIDPNDTHTPEDESAGQTAARETALLAELSEVFGHVDPVPPEVVAAARASFTWRTVDAELAVLAELAFDSLVDDTGGTLVRGAAAEQPRLLTFRS